MDLDTIIKGEIADKMQYSGKFNKKCTGKMLKGYINKKIDAIKSELLVYSGELNTYKGQIPQEIPQMSKSWYGIFSDKMKSDKSLPKERYSYSYEYSSEDNGMSEEQAKAVEGYNNTVQKMYSIAEDMYALEMAYKMLDNKRTYDIDMREAMYFGILDK
jgi:hypothetical protein